MFMAFLSASLTPTTRTPAFLLSVGDPALSEALFPLLTTKRRPFLFAPDFASSAPSTASMLRNCYPCPVMTRLSLPFFAFGSSSGWRSPEPFRPASCEPSFGFVGLSEPPESREASLACLCIFLTNFAKSLSYYASASALALMDSALLARSP